MRELRVDSNWAFPANIDNSAEGLAEAAQDQDSADVIDWNRRFLKVSWPVIQT